MRASLLSCTALAGLLASASAPALAADYGKTGFYAGLVGGYSHSDFDISAGPVGAAPNQFASESMHAGEFGLVGGYRFDLPNNTFFIEAEVEALVSMGRETQLLGSQLKIEKDGSLGVYIKPGYHINDKWGAFLTLGAHWVEYTATNAPAGFERTDRAAGFLYGIGTNYRLDKDVSLTAEYNRVHLNDLRYEHDPGVTYSRFETDIDMVKVALKYHF